MSCVLVNKGALLSLSILAIYALGGLCFKIRSDLAYGGLRLFDKLSNLINDQGTDHLVHSKPLAETIYGLSSGIPEGGCGVAVVRISGPKSLQILDLLTSKKALSPLLNSNSHGAKAERRPREAKLCKLYSLIDHELIDQAIAIYYKSPNSYTGEDVVELHTHGSKAVILELFDNFRHISSSYGIALRQAERGEFTRRAFYSGKFNLTQVEGIRDLISSTSSIERKNSILKLDNTLYKLYSRWMHELLEVIARVEGSIDFQEESCSDIILRDSSVVRTALDALSSDIKSYINNKKEMISGGIKLLLVGPPNSGKSTFINNLFGEDISIVSDLPGTTRDLIRVQYKLNHLNFQIVDTAGLRSIPPDEDVNDVIERIGIDKVLKELRSANIVLFLFDPMNVQESLYSLDRLFSNLISSGGAEGVDKLLYLSIGKADLITDPDQYSLMVKSHLEKLAHDNSAHNKGGDKVVKTIQWMRIFTSCNLDRTDVDQIMSAINSQLVDHFDLRGSALFIDDQRHKSHLNRVVQLIHSAIDLIDSGKFELEIISEYLKGCVEEIESIVGERADDGVLDRIFSTFCVGK